MGRVTDTARWAMVSGFARVAGAVARRTGDPVGSALTGDAFVEDPFAFYEQVRSQGRIVPGRFVWPTADYRVVREVLRDNRFVKAQADDRELPLKFRMIERRADPSLPHPLAPPSMLSVNPPAHTRYRTLVSKAFTPRAIELLRPRIEELADEMLSDAADKTDFDLVADYAGLLPVAVIGEVLGIPMTDRGYFRALGARLARMIDLAVGLSDYTGAMAALRELDRFFDQHLARIRKDPGEDMLSKLVQVDVDGDRLTDHELKTTAILLLVAGFETTVNLISNGLMLLLDNPGEAAKLRDNASLWPNAVEEMLRYDSPVQYTGRVSIADADLDGVHIPKHRLVALLIGGANHDPDVFPDPYRFDVARENAREHLAFAAGIHFCLGASLARLEGQIALPALLERFPDLALAGTPRRRRTRLLRGYDSVPLRLRAPRVAPRAS